MEYESEREMAIAYRMHNKGYDIGYIAATLDESEQTIEQWIYDEDRARGREEGMQLLAQVALMLLDEERYADLKRLGDEAFRNQAIEEYEKKKEQEKTGTSEPRQGDAEGCREGAAAYLVCSGREPDQGRNEGKKLTGNFRTKASLE